MKNMRFNPWWLAAILTMLLPLAISCSDNNEPPTPPGTEEEKWLGDPGKPASYVGDIKIDTILLQNNPGGGMLPEPDGVSVKILDSNGADLFDPENPDNVRDNDFYVEIYDNALCDSLYNGTQFRLGDRLPLGFEEI